VLPVRSSRRTQKRILAAAAALAAVLGATAAPGASPQHFADADDAVLVAKGHRVYAESCAGCHGRNLQGQALWQLHDRYAARRAPAHDATGHTWQHSDDDLFHMTKFGRFPGTPASTVSYMPAFAAGLSDGDILAVLAFIKSRWPIGLRAAQATLNPGFAGMPANLGSTKWSLPPNCSASFQNWAAGSR
jgi:mono/diheme cytochrome c family protein